MLITSIVRRGSVVMLKILAYPLSLVYYLTFGLLLIVYQPIQWICLNLFGYQTHKLSVDGLEFFILRCLNLLGTRFSFENPYSLPVKRPLIIVSNHQSMYDIPPLIWFFRQHHPKFISKKELGRGIPSVSYNLRHGGSVLIDRKNPAQAVAAIEQMANYIERHGRSVVIFPEGSRSRTGKPKPFKTRGLLTLIKKAPNAIIIPVSINNSWKLLKYGNFPMSLGVHFKIKVNRPILPHEREKYSQITQHIESQITKEIV